MLSISDPLVGLDRLNYYLTQTRTDYYTEGGEQPGRWAGELAEQWGLEGEISPTVLRQLWQGYSPDGSIPLVKNAGDPERRCAWDLTFSAPKSVAVLWSQSTPEVRAIIEELHAEAVNETLAQIEQVAAYSRSGKGGRNWERTPILAVVFPQGTSRANDPLIHSHVLVLNLARRADGRTGGLTTDEFFRLKLPLGAHFQAALANRLEQRLGLAIEWKAKTFSLRDVPRKLCVEMSKRRTSMLHVFDRTGGYSAVAAKSVALLTRPNKTQVPYAKLFDKWQQDGRAFGWSTAEAQALIQRDRRQTLATPEPRQSVTERRLEVQEPTTGLKTKPEPVALDRTTDTQAARGAKASQEISEKLDTAERDARRTMDGASARKGQSEKTAKVGRALPDASNGSQKEQNGSAGRSGRERKASDQENKQRTERGKRSKSSRVRPEDAARNSANRHKLAEALRRYVPLEVRQHYPFWRAQSWNPARSFHVPHLALKRQKREPDTVLGERKIPFVRVQLRKGRLFPKAPAWSPASEVKAYRVAVLWNAVEKRRATLNARKQAATIRKGDQVRFERTDTLLGIRRGQTGTVVSVGRKSVTVRFEDASRRKIQLDQYPYLTVLKRQKEEQRREARGEEQKRAEEERKRKAQEAKREAEARRKRAEEEERKRREEAQRRQQSRSNSHSHSR